MAEDKNVESLGGNVKPAHGDENDVHSMKNGVPSDSELASPDDAAEIEKVERVYRKIDKRIIPRKSLGFLSFQHPNKNQHSGFFTSPALPSAPTWASPRP